jgi:hypothetical protein
MIVMWSFIQDPSGMRGTRVAYVTKVKCGVTLDSSPGSSLQMSTGWVIIRGHIHDMLVKSVCYAIFVFGNDARDIDVVSELVNHCLIFNSTFNASSTICLCSWPVSTVSGNPLPLLHTQLPQRPPL